MNIKIKLFLVILTVFVISCKNPNKENESNNSKQNEVVAEEKQDNKTETSKIDTVKITEQLQGKWKESEYPYRTAEFVGSTVKFVEEGTKNKPVFEKFEIPENCEFDNNNIKDLKPGDIILSLPETKRCEKLKVSNDTLTLSGYKAYTNKDYNIIYVKV